MFCWMRGYICVNKVAYRTRGDAMKTRFQPHQKLFRRMLMVLFLSQLFVVMHQDFNCLRSEEKKSTFTGV